MNGLYLFAGAVVFFALSYWVYGKYLCRCFGIDPARVCPSLSKQDGHDFSPAPAAVLFGHHFASIAGSGPIVGPVIAAIFGWAPAALWVLIGCVFVGSMHDFAAMFLSVRNEGRSIAYIIERELGYLGRQIFLLFCLATLLLIVAVFTIMVAQTFVSTPSVATSSVLFILVSPFFAVALRQKMLSLPEASAVFVPLLFLCVWLGCVFPLDLSALLGSAENARTAARLGLLYYAFVASVLPVWILLQPRDYLNSYLLIGTMLLGIVGVICYRPEFSMPAFVNPVALVPESKLRLIPDLLPLLFVTIACGACSGFHALVSSGTTSKQIASERHIQPVSMGAMLVEGILAILAITSVAYLKYDDFAGMFYRADFVPTLAFARGIASFTAKLGLPYNFGVSFLCLSVSAFMLTSLDTAARLARFIWQELFLSSQGSTDGVQEMRQESAPVSARQPLWQQVMANRWVCTGIIIVLSGVLVFSDSVLRIWPVFGAANQLMAALTLIVLTLWLLRTGRKVWFGMLPALLMTTVSVWSLIILIGSRWEKEKLLAGIGCILLVAAILLLALSANTVRRHCCARACQSK
ncbi:MAG: carbon starvation protein A [Oligosphaeraceae bacterium]|nr:carbon starvation protein A [Oligosphaeraceae bacterium]